MSDTSCSWIRTLACLFYSLRLEPYRQHDGTCRTDCATKAASCLLESFKHWRNGHFSDNDNAHLLTGHDRGTVSNQVGSTGAYQGITWDSWGGTIGMAYLGAICDQDSVGESLWSDDVTTVSR
jgi:hypothetical protein